MIWLCVCFLVWQNAASADEPVKNATEFLILNDLIPDLSDILPPKHKAGEVIKTVEEAEVNLALDHIQKKRKFLQDRSVALSISNVGGEVLYLPHIYLFSGQVNAPQPYRVQPPGQKKGILDFTNVNGQSALNMFVKKEMGPTGVAGVTTYDVNNTDHRIAVMFSIPFDNNLHQPHFNIKVYPKKSSKLQPGYKLYTQMYHYAGPFQAGGWEERTEYGINVKATMTDSSHAKLMVFVDSSNYNRGGNPDVHAACNYHYGWSRWHCWKECETGGWCWINKRCGSGQHCPSDWSCYSKC